MFQTIVDERPVENATTNAQLGSSLFRSELPEHDVISSVLVRWVGIRNERANMPSSLTLFGRIARVALVGKIEKSGGL
jgi:hypothetical protein